MLSWRRVKRNQKPFWLNVLEPVFDWFLTRFSTARMCGRLYQWPYSSYGQLFALINDFGYLLVILSASLLLAILYLVKGASHFLMKWCLRAHSWASKMMR